MDPHVLIVSTKLDVATDAVVQDLSTGGVRVTRINTEELPFAAALTLSLSSQQAARSEYRLPGGIPWELDSISSCFYRRVRIPPQPAGMDEGTYNFCLRESRSALLGGLVGRTIPFMNDPRRVWTAELKPYQLQVARAFGLPIPDTIVSNDPQRIREHFKRCNGRLVVKQVRSGYVEQPDGPRAIFTTRLASSDLTDDHALALSPAIYQELIPKSCDVRVTVIGRRVFAAAIHSQTDPAAAVDWRHTDDPALPHEAIALPGPVQEQLLRLLRHLGLHFGAIDLAQTPSGEFVFLEVNPSGQWLWLEDMLGLPITAAITEWLAGPQKDVD